MKIVKLFRRSLWVTTTLLVLALIVYDAVTVSPQNLISLLGIMLMLIFSYTLSTCSADVNWGLIGSGVVFQLVVGLIVMRWPTGNNIIAEIASLITGFLNYGNYGARCVFGETYTEHGFALSVMPLLCFFTAVISSLYYLGALQSIVRSAGGVLQSLIGTSSVESFVATANIFFGPEVSVIMIKSMLPTLTEAQLFTLFCCGLSNMDAGMFPVYANIGVPASQLISASMISAPAAIVFSKLITPDDVTFGKSKRKQLIFHPSPHANLIDAFTGGASDAVPIICQVLVLMFMSQCLLQFADNTLSWFGDRVGIEQLTVQEVFSYAFTPVSFLLGVQWSDCRTVARLIGVKTLLNEYVAYIELAELIDNRKHNCSPSIQPRSEAIAAYALCGYSNFGAVAMMMAVLISLAPAKSGVISGMTLKAFIAGNLACLSAACTAGVFYNSNEG